MALETVPDNVKNVAMGIYQTFVALGISLVPSLIGALVDHTSNLFTYNIIGVANIALIIYSFFTNREDIVKIN